ncbi:biopolymer transporter ExbD [candidate division KSB1 bacterium]|nr:biopolymer transporter ExbD [candidate division KSB1 bacterium]
MFSEETGFKLYTRSPRKRNVQVSLKLTSMIDMFTILLVFLLKSFSAEGQIVTVSSDLQLPESTATRAPVPSSTIAITNDWLLVDGKQVASMAEVNSARHLLIPNLANELRQLRTVSETVGNMSADMGFTGKISIQGDREIPYIILKKVMYTCGQIGYNDILLTVMQME